MKNNKPFIIAIPKGRVYEDFMPLLQDSVFAIKDDQKKSRKMLLDTKNPDVKVLVIRGWDIPTYITTGAADLGIVGKDILLEKDEEEFVELLDLKLVEEAYLMPNFNKDDILIAINSLSCRQIKIVNDFQFDLDFNTKYFWNILYN